MQSTIERGVGRVDPPPFLYQPLRVAYCIDGMGVGGTEMNAVRTAERLDRRRYALTVVALNADGPLRARYDAAGIPVEAFPIPNIYGARAVRQGLRLRRFLAEQRIDVVHCHDMYTNVFVSAWARAARVPVVITSRRWELFAPSVYALPNRLAYRASDCVLANSAAVARLVRDETALPAERVAVVPNFVDDAAFEPMDDLARARALAELGVPRGAFVVGVVANLTPIKDHATLVRAVARLAARRPMLHLVLVGDGPCRPAIAALAEELGISGRVHFAGLRPHLPNLHHLFHLSALTSTSEGFPNSLVEAMAAGRAVVATRVGGSPDAVEDGVTGLLVPPRDPGSLAAAIETLAADDDRRRLMGERARDVAAERFTASAAVGALEALYDRLAGARRSSARAGARGRG